MDAGRRKALGIGTGGGYGAGTEIQRVNQSTVGGLEGSQAGVSQESCCSAVLRARHKGSSLLEREDCRVRLLGAVQRCSKAGSREVKSSLFAKEEAVT